MYPVYRSLTCIRVALLFCLVPCLLVAGAWAADASYTGYLGDVIDLHGYSYAGGEEVYLFMTGPGLPANGVTLTDVSQRADQGQFTTVPLDSSQQWSMKWDTSRIENEIDPGTYTVYVTTTPVDYSQLGGSSSYQTLSVYLKDPGTSTGSSSASYTLHPVEQVSSPTVTSVSSARSVVVTTPAVSQTPLVQPTTPSFPVTTATARATTKAAPVQPATVVIAVLLGVTGLIACRRAVRT